MNRLRITFDSRRHFVFLATMAALFFLLAEGANAQSLTVRCVPKHTINSSCYVPATEYTHIQDAVNAANSGDIILVASGYYPESVTINTDSLSLFGAQAGNDARVGRQNTAKESIVDAKGAGPTFTISVPYVIIDGFTIKGGTAATSPAFPAGILEEGGQGLQILNNIIEANTTGIFLFESGGSVIEHNLITNNNVVSGGFGGCGVMADLTESLGISDNAFVGNHAAALAIAATLVATITNNTSQNDGSFVVFLSVSNGLFSHNQGWNFGSGTVLPVYFPGGPTAVDADAAVDIGFGNQILEINDNDLEERGGSVSNGVAFTIVFGSTFNSLTDSENVLLKNNTIKGFKENGIVAETDKTVEPTQGMTRYSSIVGNQVGFNGEDGISIVGAGIYNTNISLFDNQVTANHLDCQDGSSGTGYTLTTHNTWFNDIGITSDPVGLCTQGRGH